MSHEVKFKWLIIESITESNKPFEKLYCKNKLPAQQRENATSNKLISQMILKSTPLKEKSDINILKYFVKVSFQKYWSFILGNIALSIVCWKLPEQTIKYILDSFSYWCKLLKLGQNSLHTLNLIKWKLGKTQDKNKKCWCQLSAFKKYLLF